MQIDLVIQNLFITDPNVNATIMHGHHPGSQFDPNEMFGMISFTPTVTLCINREWKPLNRGMIDAQVNYKNSENPTDDEISLSNGPHYFIFNGCRSRAFIKAPRVKSAKSELNLACFGKALPFTEAKQINQSTIDRIKQSRITRRNQRSNTSNIHSIINSTSSQLRSRFNTRSPNNNSRNYNNRNNNNYNQPNIPFNPNTSNNDISQVQRSFNQPQNSWNPNSSY